VEHVTGARLLTNRARYADTEMIATVEQSLRHFEQRLGIDRRGRSVWVWLLPPLVGVLTGAIGAFMPGLPDDFGWPLRLTLGLFGFVSMTLISVIYLIAFDDDRNQRADDVTRS
jgi:hypothetical protein